MVMNLSSEKKLKVRALWDTGATNTMVSKKIAAALALKKTGEISVQSFAGEACWVFTAFPSKIGKFRRKIL